MTDEGRKEQSPGADTWWAPARRHGDVSHLGRRLQVFLTLGNARPGLGGGAMVLEVSLRDIASRTDETSECTKAHNVEDSEPILMLHFTFLFLHFRGFCPTLLSKATTIHTHIHTPTVVSTTQGDSQLVRSSQSLAWRSRGLN